MLNHGQRKGGKRMTRAIVPARSIGLRLCAAVALAVVASIGQAQTTTFIGGDNIYLNASSNWTSGLPTNGTVGSLSITAKMDGNSITNFRVNMSGAAVLQADGFGKTNWDLNDGRWVVSNGTFAGITKSGVHE